MRDASAPDEQQSYTLFALAGAVLIFGLVMLGSATAPVGAEKFGSAYYFLVRQLAFGVVPGVILFFLLRQIPMSWWERAYKLMFVLSIIAAALVFVPGLGLRINGSLSWIHMGPYSMQPAELLKLTFIAFLAGWLVHHRRHLSQSFSQGLAPYLMYSGVVIALVLAQPDLGTALVLAASVLIMAHIAGAQLKHMAIIGLLGVAVLGALVAAAPYRMDRITALWNPDRDPYGSGYHIRQSLVAVGSGGLLGLGLGNSRQKFQYLPEVSADSIFAVIAEEMGFVICALLIFAYVMLVVRGYALARRSSSEWAKFFIIGTMTWIGVQVVANIGAMLAVVPLTGLPLPLVSHGGTALMVTIAAFGVISAAVSPPQRRVVRHARSV